jgi:hypothetical protein
MLTVRKIFGTATIVAMVVVGVYAVYRSSVYQQCTADKAKQASYQQEYERYATLMIHVDCLGPFAHETHGPIVAVFTIILAGSTILLWISTRDTAIAAKVAAEHIPRVERAYLFLWKELKHKITPNPLGGDILEVQFAFHNHGKTPAILRRIEVDIRVIERYPTTLREIAEDMPMGFALSSEGTTPFFPRRQLIKPEHWTNFKQRKCLLLFLGVVKYNDVFGDPHETGFCLEWDVISGQGGFSPSPTDTLNYYT